MVGVEKTTLEQQTISDPAEAITIFNAKSDTTAIPIVLVPEPRLCCSCCFTVPTGANSIIEECGADADPESLADAGLHCAPYWKRVAYMVSPQAITYNAPVKACPTKDNVMVDCDLSLVLHIGNLSRPQDVKNFVYKLGARRFNEYLSAASDEGIRQLVRDTPLDDVYELRGSGGQAGPEGLLTSLSTTFKPYGIEFKRAVITDVHIGDELVEILQGTTEFSAKIEEAIKEHDHKLKLIAYDHDQRMRTLDKDYDRRIQDAQNDQTVAIVNREEEKVNAESRRAVNFKNAEEKASVDHKRAQADFEVITAQAQEQNQTLLGQVQSECEQKKIAAAQEAKVRIADSQAELDASRDRAQAVLAVATAEGGAIEKLKAIREHKLRLAQMEVFENVAKTSKLCFSGETGEKFLASMIDFSSEL